MAKPYSIQSPEDIAKEYGGNKQRIAQAMQLGVVDATAGVLAGMFIDRMRSAAQSEAAPRQTVAQQVFTPPQPQMPMGAPAGLGATPQAAAMPAPAAPMAAPAAPPMAAPPMGMPAPQAVPGMAAGGMVGPYMARGGLSDLPVPDDMFDEPSNGGFDDGYRGGGLVAFAQGDKVVAQPSEYKDPNTIMVSGRRPTPPEEVDEPTGPYEYYGNFRDPFRMKESIEELAPQSTKRREQVNTYLERILDPAEQKKRRQEDMWMALGQIGAKMASTPGSLLQAASAGIGEALPGVAAAAKERRAEERGALTELARNEGLSNTEARDMYRLIREGTNKYGEFNEARLSREQLDKLERYKEQQANWRTLVSGQYQLAGARESASASRYGADREFRARRAAIFDNVYSNLLKNAAYDEEYQRRFKVNPNSADLYLRSLAEREVQRQLGGGTVDLGSY